MLNIRNFCIIAHIDHGKSTLADRLLEATGTISPKDMQAQLLDSMDLERERGITIKSHAIQMQYKFKDVFYTLNLIDTPGHVDFSYEVSRAIAACEGALLIVDASQSIEAQTISNLYLAIEQSIQIIPVVNKIDLPSARTEEVKEEIVALLGCEKEDIIEASAKEGIGIKVILHAIIHQIPSPKGSLEAPLQAMIFDSKYNPFKGVEVYMRIFNGEIKKGDAIQFMHTKKVYHVDEIGILKLKHIPKESLQAGNVGYITAGLKVAKEVKVGDTITHLDKPCKQNIKGFEEVKPMVFIGIYPMESDQYEDLRQAMEKLTLNDAAIVWEHESSLALGFGFRCGFLGMLHMEITQERLQREFNIKVIPTVPSVEFHVYTIKNECVKINSPSEMPDPVYIQYFQEPFVKIQIITKPEFVGNIMKLCMERRGLFKNQIYLMESRVELIFEMPLMEVIFDFFDKLKVVSKGYASLDYELLDFRTSTLVKLDILLNYEKIDAFSSIIHQQKAYDFGKRICNKLKDILPRQMFDIPIQASIGSKVIARETIKALRKNVTAKCYGGDISRKRKLLEKQKKGKKKLKMLGNVEVPQEAFLSILNASKEE